MRLLGITGIGNYLKTQRNISLVLPIPLEQLRWWQTLSTATFGQNIPFLTHPILFWPNWSQSLLLTVLVVEKHSKWKWAPKGLDTFPAGRSVRMCLQVQLKLLRSSWRTVTPPSLPYPLLQVTCPARPRGSALRVIHLSVLSAGPHHNIPESLEIGSMGSSNFLYGLCLKNVPSDSSSVPLPSLPWSWIVRLLK